MTTAPPLTARFIRVAGIVQGVGFRPFVYRLAERHSLAGWVRNVAGAVEIHLEGAAPELDAFLLELRSEAPSVSRIDTLEFLATAPTGANAFALLASADASGNRPVTADLAICPDCEAELFDPA